MARDIAGVIAPPPLLFLGPLLLALGIDLGLGPPALGLELPARAVLAVPLLALGATCIVLALGRFRAADTPPQPWEPSTALVVEGIYKLTRNPMYLGMALTYAGLAVAFDSLVALLFLPLALLIVDRAVIAREERYMAAKFGAPYAAYRAKVRRWI